MTRFGRGTWRQYPYWMRGPARIVGDEVVLDEDRAEEYYMYEPTELLFDLAEIGPDPQNRDSQNVLAFVRRYGLLWHGADKLGSGECREPLNDWWNESYNLAVIADLYVRLKDSVESGSTEILYSGNIDYEAFGEESIMEDDDALREFTSLLLAEEISIKLEGCNLGLASSMGLDVEPRGPLNFLMTQGPPNLVVSAYAQLAMAIVNRAPMTECPGCGRLFVPESNKQKYHSKSCASTSRWRRWKANQES